MAVDAAMASGALGARMMGGGFGGSALALVPAGQRAVSAAITAEFARRGWPRPGVLPGGTLGRRVPPAARRR